MVEVTKPDYLSLVNKSGSGLNVSELVTSIVAAEIEPKRALQNTKLEKIDNAISGIGYLNSQATSTKTKLTTISADRFYNVTSSNPTGISFNITDETKVNVGSSSISNVTTAKKMIYEFAGFTNVTDQFSANLTLNFGTWTNVGGTHTFDSSTNLTSAKSINFSNKNINQIAALIDAESGLSAKVINVSASSTPAYSLIITSDNVGASNGFQISGDLATFTTQTTNTAANKFNQLATDANFTFDGVNISRTSNVITDLLDGVDIELKTDFSSVASLFTNRLNSSVKTSVQNVILALNEFNAEINRLTYIDIDGDQNGPLAMDPAAIRLKSEFKKIAMTPLTGFGIDPIYLSQLGIKSNGNGEYYLDETLFNKTLASNPEYFLALKDEYLSTDNNSVKAYTSASTILDEGIYEISTSDGGTSYKISKSGAGNTEFSMLKIPFSGGTRLTSTQFAGLRLESAELNPSSFKLIVGKSFSKRVSDLMEQTLALTSSLNNAKENYKTTSVDINERLEQLEVREKLITAQYTERFGAMEQSMTQFNSTKTLLDNFVEAWKKQK